MSLLLDETDWKQADASDRSLFPAIALPAIPQQPFDFDSCSLVVRSEGEEHSIELIDPKGVRMTAPTKMQERPNDPDALGESLFPVGIKESFQAIRAECKKQGKGLRLQIEFRGKCRAFLLYPWESVRLDGEYLLSDPALSITRVVSSNHPPLAFGETPSPYRLLMVMACPKGLVDIQQELENDLAQIQSAMADLIQKGHVEITVLKGTEASFLNIKKTLASQPHQALYLASHGTFANRIGNVNSNSEVDGVVILDDGQGNPHQIFGVDLGEMLQASSVRLMMFGTVYSAYGKSPQGEGVAEMISHAGIPAVVAFQKYEIDSRAISRFAGAFFSQLTRLNSLDLAVLAGRKACQELGGNIHWTYPMVFTRFRADEKVFSGELGGKISAYVNEAGEVEFVEQKEEGGELGIVKRQLKALSSMLNQIQDIEDRTKLQNEIFAANRLLQHNDLHEAINTLTNASMLAVAGIKRQQALEVAEEEQRKQRKRKQTERVVILVLAGVMMLVVGLIASSQLFEGADTYIIKGLELPLTVVLWSFIGGVAATLYAFVGTQKYAQTEPLRVDWLIGRPIVGVIMGSVVYLAILTTLDAVGNTESEPDAKLLWVLAFIGGFSDKFAILLFDNLVGKFTTSKEADSEKASAADGNSV